MKRAFSRDDDNEPVNGIQDIGLSLVDSKKPKAKLPSHLVGPLLFNASNTHLERALLAVEPSTLSGVHRMVPQTNSIVRLWAPNLGASNFLQIDVSEFLHAIDGKCIFIFDPRASENDQGVAGSEKAVYLFQNNCIKRFGILISQFPPPNVGAEVIQNHMPVVQDPEGIIASLCNYSSYLGPSLVLVKDSEVKATCMVSRSPEALQQTLLEWMHI